MAIPANTTRVSILGTGPGAEIFNVSFWVAPDAPQNATDANTYAGLIRDAWQTNAAANWKAWLANDQAYTEVKVYGYPNGGPVATAIGSAAIASGTGTGTAKGALGTSLVVSLRTPFAGRRMRGRMYVPATGKIVDTGHLFMAADINTISTTTKAFLDAVNAYTQFGPLVVVSQVGAGVVNNVSEIWIDNKPDYQRRRANKLAANHVAKTALA